MHHITNGTLGSRWPKGTGTGQTEVVLTDHRMQHFFHRARTGGRATLQSHLSITSPGKLSLRAAASSPIHRAMQGQVRIPSVPMPLPASKSDTFSCCTAVAFRSCSTAEQGFAMPAIPLLQSSAAAGRLLPLLQPSCLWPWSCMALCLLHAWKAQCWSLKIA